MNFNLRFPKLSTALLLSFILTSCSKDADLLSEYVINDNDQSKEIGLLIQNDFVTTQPNTSIVIDVLSNDNYDNWENVKIISVSAPENGEVILNDNKTLTYIPDGFLDTSETAEQAPTEEPETTSEPESTPEPETTPESESESTSEPETTPESEPESTSEPETAPEPETSTETVEDTFTYTTEVTNPEDNTTTTEEATVTVVVTNSTLATSGENIYYVTTSGNSNNDGKSENSAWNLEHALKNARSGTIIYVKKGTYFVNDNESFQYNNFSEAIKVIGYEFNPGDLSINTNSKEYLINTLQDTRYPIIQGKNNKTSIGYSFNGNASLELNNLIIRNFQIGLLWGISNGKLNNIIFDYFGTQDQGSWTDGEALRITGNENEIINTSIRNSGSIAVNTSGEKNVFRNCILLGDNNARPMGYYLVFSGSNANYNIVENCALYRYTGDNGHQGHGFIVKNGGQYNIFRNSTAVNVGIEASYKNTRNNTWENITLETTSEKKGSTYSAGIRIMNGSNNNTFKNILIRNNISGIEFRDYDDGSSSNENQDANEGGSSNTFVNIIVDSVTYGLWFTDGQNGNYTSFSQNNTFINCTFNDINKLMSINQNINNLKFYNSIFNNISEYITGGNGQLDNLDYNTCSFSNIGFNRPSGSNLIGAIPNFVNDALTNLRINNSALNVGLNAEQINVLAKDDFYGKIRPTPCTLGAIQQ
ncbi:hypothetical protein [uncultured Maribacter sp.]|uniref:Ig-like domain-containing protein n=1 Tax=uncultured Maribacter sp. TaxID=431308 RepID=UPI00261C73F2|nr:hypothetical protein [uncultured Maribacter sp.]